MEYLFPSSPTTKKSTWTTWNILCPGNKIHVACDTFHCLSKRFALLCSVLVPAGTERIMSLDSSHWIKTMNPGDMRMVEQGEGILDKNTHQPFTGLRYICMAISFCRIWVHFLKKFRNTFSKNTPIPRFQASQRTLETHILSSLAENRQFEIREASV